MSYRNNEHVTVQVDQGLKQEVDKLTSDLAQKAEQEDLDNTNTQVTNLNQNLQSGLTTKVDKGGNEQITWGMLDQATKENITGGNTAVVGQNSVNTSNIVDRAVTNNKRTPIGEMPVVIVSHPNINPVPNVNTTNQTLTFYEDTILIWRKTFHRIETNTVIDLATAPSSAKKIYFNTETKTFRALSFNYIGDAISENEILVATLRLVSDRCFMHINSRYTVNGEVGGIEDNTINANKIINIHPMWKTCSVLSGGGGFPYVDNTNKRLVFPPNPFDWIVYVGETNYSGSIPPTGLTIDLSSATGTSAWCILFNPSDKTFLLVPWSSVAVYKKTHALFATFRIYSGKYHFNMPYPFIVDGTLYGYKDSKNVVLNPLNANVKAIAHRGYSSEAPENTLPAYKLAKDKGFTYVECDIEWTSDGVPVVLHDSTIDRTSNGTGNIREMTLSEAKTYDFGSWKSAVYAGTQIPTLEEFILFCKKLNLHPYIEIKGLIDSTQAQTLTSIVRKLGMVDRVTWIGSYAASLTEILNIENGTNVAFVMGEYHPTLREQAIQLKSIVTKKIIVSISVTGLTKESAEEVFVDGFDLEVWTVNDPNDVHRLVEMGVSGITTDFINIAEILQS